MKRLVVAGSFAFVSLAIVACGSEGSKFVEETGPDAGVGPGLPSGNGETPEIGPTGTASACVTSIAGAELAPTNLIFMYDKSGSMGYLGDNPDFDPSKKWIPVGDGMKAFFADPYSKTLRASLQFFPDGDLPDPPVPDPQTEVNEVCTFDYATPKVALTSAADPAFVAAINGATPAGGTPTTPALKGAITYAEKIVAEHPGEKTLVVFVSDGEPGFVMDGKFVPGCQNMENTIEAAASLAKDAFAKKIPTYVVGVGPSLDKLNAIASAGGTTSALMVDISDPAKSAEKIRTALNEIRKKEASCDFGMPAPPEGEILDPLKVNVVLKTLEGTDKVLAYSKDCTDPEGWRYDNADAPTRVLLCTASCDETKASSEGKVSIAFGCKTKISIR